MAPIYFRARVRGKGGDICTEILCLFHRIYLQPFTVVPGNQEVLRVNRYSKILMNNKSSLRVLQDYPRQQIMSQSFAPSSWKSSGLALLSILCPEIEASFCPRVLALLGSEVVQGRTAATREKQAVQWVIQKSYKPQTRLVGEGEEGGWKTEGILWSHN